MKLILIVRKYTWYLIATIPAFRCVFTYCSVAIAKIEMNFLFKKYHRPKISLKEILKRIKNESDTCHILGNGNGVINSVKHIRSGEYVIAMNSGVFHCVKINMYMSELHNERDESLERSKIIISENIKYANDMYKIIRKKNPECILLLKNMMKDNISPNLYDPDCMLINLPEIVYRYFPLHDKYIKFQKYLVNYILNKEKDIVIQTSSSITTAITLAYKAGFKKIYIHGLNGGGCHYFHSEFFNSNLNSMESEVLSYLKRLLPKVSPDVTNEAGKHSQLTLQYFTHEAKKRGVTVSKIENIFPDNK